MKSRRIIGATREPIQERRSLRRELLNAEWFATTRQAQTVINQWLLQYTISDRTTPSACRRRPPTDLVRGEIITGVFFPTPQRAAYVKFANPASRFALVGVFVAQTTEGVRVAVTGAGPCVYRLTEAERLLSASFTPNALADFRVPALGLNSDIHADASYRAHLVAVIARRAVAAALG